MPRRDSDFRSEAVRHRIPVWLWEYLEQQRDWIRKKDPRARIAHGGRGTRQVFVMWVDARMREWLRKKG